MKHKSLIAISIILLGASQIAQAGTANDRIPVGGMDRKPVTNLGQGAGGPGQPGGYSSSDLEGMQNNIDNMFGQTCEKKLEKIEDQLPELECELGCYQSSSTYDSRQLCLLGCHGDHQASGSLSSYGDLWLTQAAPSDSPEEDPVGLNPANADVVKPRELSCESKLENLEDQAADVECQIGCYEKHGSQPDLKSCLLLCQLSDIVKF